MYYEEKIENDQVYWRGTPDGNWNLMTHKELVNKYAEQKEQVSSLWKRLQRKSDELETIIYNLKQLT